MRHDLLPPNQLSRELRLASGDDMRRRRWAIGLSIAGAAIGAVVGAYQTGLLRRLPDILPGDIWDAERVDASNYAYKRLQQPDGFMMLVTYGLTAALASTGGADRAERQPILPLLAAGKAATDLATAAKLAQEEWAENKALCSWCQVATLASAATLAVLLPEAVRAAGNLNRAA